MTENEILILSNFLSWNTSSFLPFKSSAAMLMSYADKTSHK